MKLGFSTTSSIVCSAIFAVVMIAASTLPTTEANALCVNSRVASWDVLWIRKGPGTSYSKRRGIPAKACGVRRAGKCKGNWCRVNYKGTSGWTNVRYLNDHDGDDSIGNGGGYQCKRWERKCDNGAEWACEKYDSHDCGAD